MIQTAQLTKQYDSGFIAVNQLNLNVQKGDIYGFLGPNGAGKTTTIRMLNGLLSPTEGHAFVNGLDIRKHAEQIKQGIGVLPESHGFYNWMTGKEYLSLFAELYGMNKEKIKQRVNETLELVGLTDRANDRITWYSRGMRQRLGLAKTMIHEPYLIFLDEPTLGLDPQGQKDIQNLILNLKRQKGVTIFITSHLLKDIAEICNRVAIVKRGELIAEGELTQFMDTYRKQIKKDQITLEDVFFHLTSPEEKGRDER